MNKRKSTNYKKNKPICFRLRIQFVSLVNYLILRFFQKKFNSEVSDGNNIVIVNTLFLGDILVCIRLLKRLEMSGKYSGIYLVLRNEYKDIFEAIDCRINIIPINMNRYRYDLIYRHKFLCELRQLTPHHAMNLNQARGLISDELILTSGASYSYCFSPYSRYISDFVLDKVNLRYNELFSSELKNEYERIDAYADHLNLPDYSFSHLFLTEYANTIYRGTDDCILVAPLVRNDDKGWPLNDFRRVVEELSKIKTVLLLGSPDQYKSLNELVTENTINTAGKIELNTIPSLMEKASLYIGNNSGLSHIAFQMNIPSIIITGGGDDNRFFIKNSKNENARLMYHDMDCFGCDWQCIYHEKFCITKVKSDEIILLAQSIFSQG